MKAVIFDLDGTLVDSQPLQFTAYKKAFEEVQLTLSWEDWKNYWVKLSINAYEWASMKNLDYNPDKIREKKREIYEDLIKNELKAKPGAVRIVHTLKKFGFKLGIASSSRIESIQLIIDKLFPSIFDVLQSDTELAKKKPDPEVFLLAMKKLVVKPQETLIIEDSLSGYQGAIQSGATCIICPDKTVGLHYDFPKAKMVIESLEGLTVDEILLNF